MITGDDISFGRFERDSRGWFYSATAKPTVKMHVPDRDILDAPDQTAFRDGLEKDLTARLMTEVYGELHEPLLLLRNMVGTLRPGKGDDTEILRRALTTIDDLLKTTRGEKPR